MGVFSPRPFAWLLGAVCICSAVHAQTVSISVDASKTIRLVDERIFGVNAVMWDPDAATDQTIDLVNQAGIRIIRIPGGSNSNLYHWKVNRSQLQDVKGGELYESWAWSTGFDRFARLILNTNAQAFVSVNYGTGTPEEAAAWVAYANAATGTEGGTGDVPIGDDVNGSHWYTARYWANLRASAPISPDDGQNFLRIERNGPIGIRHWEIGNENYGDWERDDQIPAHDPTRYATRAKDYMAKMRAVDGTIKVGVVAVTGTQYNNWTRTLLQTLKSVGAAPDFLIYHRYDQAPGQESDAKLLQSAKTWNADAADLRMQLTDYYGTGSENVELVVTENNSVYTNPGKQSTSIVNGLFLADSVGNLLQTEFNALTWWDLRNGTPTDSSGKIVGNNAASLYGWRNYGDYGMLSTPYSGAATDYYTAYPTYYTMKLLKYFARGGDTVVQATSDNNLVAVFAAKRTADGTARLLLINKDPANTLKANVMLANFTVPANVRLYSYGMANDNAAKPDGTGCSDIESNALNLSGPSFSSDVGPYTMQVIALADESLPVASFPPTIAKQPAAAAVSSGQSAIFAASVKGCEAPTYSWEHLKSGSSTWEKLSDGDGYSGTSTTTLTIAAASTALSGDQYRVIASNTVGTVQSNAATLTVTTPAPAPTPAAPAPSRGGGGGGTFDPRWLVGLLLVGGCRARSKKAVRR